MTYFQFNIVKNSFITHQEKCCQILFEEGFFVYWRLWLTRRMLYFCKHIKQHQVNIHEFLKKYSKVITIQIKRFIAQNQFLLSFFTKSKTHVKYEVENKFSTVLLTLLKQLRNLSVLNVWSLSSNWKKTSFGRVPVLVNQNTLLNSQLTSTKKGGKRRRRRATQSSMQNKTSYLVNLVLSTT